MPYFSCEGCDHTIDLAVFDRDTQRGYCPVCEETTLWTIEFEGGGEVSL
ncbi:hypothetical protein ACFOZ7_08315 [Natribaculum luteum]|uniref:Small CPxCG-related zinc finger protein n=1 Tax=Natribaculum luteum TaxID=1586232 RepID=A0ABD5NYH3_9EURY|nr:hypothetical protein [Natribaculum luteum]